MPNRMTLIKERQAGNLAGRQQHKPEGTCAYRSCPRNRFFSRHCRRRVYRALCRFLPSVNKITRRGAAARIVHKNEERQRRQQWRGIFPNSKRTRRSCERANQMLSHAFTPVVAAQYPLLKLSLRSEALAHQIKYWPCPKTFETCDQTRLI